MFKQPYLYVKLSFLASLLATSSVGIANDYGFDPYTHALAVYDSLPSLDVEALKSKTVLQQDSYYKKCLTPEQRGVLKSLGFNISDDYCIELKVNKELQEQVYLQSEYTMRFAKVTNHLTGIKSPSNVTDAELNRNIDRFIQELPKVSPKTVGEDFRLRDLKLNFLTSEQATAVKIYEPRGVYFLEDRFTNYQGKETCIASFHIVNAPYYKFSGLERNQLFDFITSNPGFDTSFDITSPLKFNSSQLFQVFQDAKNISKIAGNLEPNLKYVRINKTFGFNEEGLILIARSLTESPNSCNYKLVTVPFEWLTPYLTKFGREYFKDIRVEYLPPKSSYGDPFYWRSTKDKSFYVNQFVNSKTTPVLNSTRYTPRTTNCAYGNGAKRVPGDYCYRYIY